MGSRELASMGRSANIYNYRNPTKIESVLNPEYLFRTDLLER